MSLQTVVSGKQAKLDTGKREDSIEMFRFFSLVISWTGGFLKSEESIAMKFHKMSLHVSCLQVALH